jgi:hypothetical protein
MNNRNEWERKGKEAIKGYMKDYFDDEGEGVVQKSGKIELPTLTEMPSKELPHSHIISPGQA